jgi:hypothetical protein
MKERASEISLRAVWRHALPSLVEGTFIPMVLVTVLIHTLGVHLALYGGLAWAYGALIRRALTGKRLPGILLLGAMGVTFRLITMMWTGSAFLFFLQPVLATVATSAAFAVSAMLGRPLTARLGADLVPLPESAWKDPEVLQLCSRMAMVWAVALLGNALLTLWMLTTLSVPTFVLLRPLVSLTTTLPAIVATVLCSQAVMRRSGARLVGLPPVLIAPTACLLQSERLISERLVHAYAPLVSVG